MTIVGVPEIAELGNFETGEVPDPLVYDYLNADGTVKDLTGAAVAFQIRLCEEGEVTAPGAGVAVLQDGPNGRVRYTWAAIDMAAPGKYYGQFVATKGANVYKSHKVLWYVSTSLDDQ